MDLSHPLFTLDPFAADARAEAKRLLGAGPVVPVDVVGVPDEQHAPLHSLCQALFDTTEQPMEVTATEEALCRFMAEPAASKAADPGDDLTSVLVEQHTSGSITHD
ncbi:hypothetical protein [Streptomyces sp. WM6378]|uniref:hypothetical protein n=1 Tax=Streptomyces sp. WM6378 TaxID=1415557 RepID=UPI0006AE98DE|nr:hypothetical protein [Streptomyces sp. WM6378]KOU34109.1 hypothetical protein ADK54_41045 [Streptomyces sp. WM6378]